jgi:hypothetical protein
MVNPKHGWQPDPTGRFELRFHNGTAWTGDVATDGQRYVDPIGAGPANALSRPPSPRNGIAAAATVLGITGAALSWLPFVFVVGVIAAVLGIVFGLVGLRRARRAGHGRALAMTGLVTGVVGVAMGSLGVVLTIATVRALDAFENPEPHAVEIVECAVDDGVARATGAIVNRGDRTADFSVLIEFRRPGTDNRAGSERVIVDDVPAGESAEFEARRPSRLDRVECVVVGVNGPLPFGVDPGG